MKFLIVILTALTLPVLTGQICTSCKGIAQPVMYVNPSTGNNSNNCSSGAKCQTLTYVLSLLPNTLDQDYTINLDNGTYAENVCLGNVGSPILAALVCTKKITGNGYRITLNGNTTTPSAVNFTGVSDAITGLFRFRFSGVLRITLAGIRFTGPTGGIAFFTSDFASISVDRCEFTGTSILRGIWAYDNATILFAGNALVSGFTDYGIDIQNGSASGHSATGTLTIIGPSASGSSGRGISIHYNSRWVAPFLSGVTASFDISNVSIGIELGLTALFQSLCGGLIEIHNTSVPGTCNYTSGTNCSSAVLSTDVSTWAVGVTNVNFRNFDIGWIVNSMSYAEHGQGGTRSFTGIVQNCLSQNIDPGVTNCTTGANKQIFLF